MGTELRGKRKKAADKTWLLSINAQKYYYGISGKL